MFRAPACRRAKNICNKHNKYYIEVVIKKKKKFLHVDCGYSSAAGTADSHNFVGVGVA